MDDVIEYYNSQNEAGRLSLNRAHHLEYITTMKYVEKFSPRGCTILDACAGTGAYSFDLAKKEYKVTAGDLVPYNVEVIKMENKKHKLLQNIYVGNILDMSQFEDESFDVVLCFGALYHLHEESHRKQAILECQRVLKTGGIIFVAYLNRFASFMNNFFYHPENYETILNEFNTGSKNIFYRTTPNEIESVMSECNIEIITNVGTEGVAFMYPKQLEDLTQENYKKYLDYHFNTCEEKEILGYSLHGLCIGKKI